MTAETPGAARRVLGASPGSVLRWLGLVALATGLLWSFRPMLDKAHMALAFLLVVLAGSARHGRRLGLTLAVLCFLCFNFFLLPPYYTFELADPLDWVVLVSFLMTGAVAAHLLDRAQRQAAAAHERAEEINRLSTLGAETLNVGRAEEAVQAIARVTQTTLRVDLCEVYGWDRDTSAARRIAHAASTNAPLAGAADDLFQYVVEGGAVAVGRMDGTTHVVRDRGAPIDEMLAASASARMILIPLKVRGQVVGVMRIADQEAIRFDSARTRLAAVLSYYAALGVERVRLVAEEERAAALREADRLKDTLLASVSHDLRTPLTTIKGLAHELASAGEERAVAMEEEAERLHRLVADLLDLSSLSAGAMRVSPEIVAAEDLVGAALQRVAGMQDERKIRVSLPAGEIIPVGRFDFSQSLRVLVNLLENALKYGPPGQPIDVRVQQDADWLVVEVMDRGPGVPPEEAERIFEPFYRRPDTLPDVRGTGLGLAISLRLAEVQGGSVEYRSRPGGGSAFSFRLPAAELPELSDTPS